MASDRTPAPGGPALVTLDMRTLWLCGCKRLALGLLLAVCLASCNVFEGFYEEGTSDDPEVLLDDAQAALRNGEPERAVAYLEKALRNAPENTEVQAALAVALLRANDVNIVTLSSLASELNLELAAAAAGPAGATRTAAAPEVCSFEPPDRRGEPVDLLGPTFLEIEGRGPVFARVIALLGGVFGLRSGTAAEFETGFARLLSAGFSRIETQTYASVLAIAYLSRAYLDVTAAGLDRVTWVQVLRPSGNAYLGLCAPTQEVIDAVIEASACALRDVRVATEALEGRVAFFDLANTAAATAAREVRSAYDVLAVELAEQACL